ncbi:hypothetical protein AB996_0367 [Lactococcus cremoris]|uniref:Uncharacterized protein n=1 Tax=Lactococcus lactis subsp. cremoris TaxID=1359 RepID=A0A166K895_LACLC|nr:hypothetical protein AB996_0367 [Lactococcus cremoris]
MNHVLFYGYKCRKINFFIFVSNFYQQKNTDKSSVFIFLLNNVIQQIARKF